MPTSPLPDPPSPPWQREVLPDIPDLRDMGLVVGIVQHQTRFFVPDRHVLRRLLKAFAIQ